MEIGRRRNEESPEFVNEQNKIVGSF
jgi:hypothetical protein